MITVHLADYFKTTAGIVSSTVQIEGQTVSEILEKLIALYPQLSAYLYEEEEISPYISIFLGKKDIRSLEGAKTLINDNDSIFIIPAMAGG